MWKVLPKFGLLKLLFFVFAAMFLAVLFLLFSQNHKTALTWDNYRQGLLVVTPVTFIFIAIIYIIGKWMWRVVWKIPLLGDVLNRSVCPDLNGLWKGYIESNYIDENGERIKKEVELEIMADFFGFKIILKSKDGYQSSNATLSELRKDSRTGVFYISYQ